MKGKEDNKTEEQTKIMENLKKKRKIKNWNHWIRRLWNKSIEEEKIIELKYRRWDDYGTIVEKMWRLEN